MIHNLNIGLKRICLIGVKGIGKTTIIKSILSEIQHMDYLIGSQVLKTIVTKDGQDFFQFDNFPELEKNNYRIQAIHFMINRQKELGKDILVDGHTSLFNPNTNRVDQVFTEHDCRFFTNFILYEVSPEIILERRKKDTIKKRILDLEIIKEEIKQERAISHQIGINFNIKIHYLSESETTSHRVLGNQLKKLLNSFRNIQNEENHSLHSDNRFKHQEGCQ